MVKPDVLKLDLYGILGVNEGATNKELVKAYRRRALKCHPDKNPDNPSAADLFLQLSQALEVLTDVAARAAYDKTIKAKRAAEERNKHLDSKRKKFKQDLEARERAAQEPKIATDIQAEERLKTEVERLRQEGCQLLLDEQERLKAHLNEPDEEDSEEDEQPQVTPKLKVRWRSSKLDVDEESIYTGEKLRQIFFKYGDVLNIIVSSKRKGAGVVEFKHAKDAQAALDNETGLLYSPLKISWLEGQPASTKNSVPTPMTHDETSERTSLEPPLQMPSYSFQMPAIPTKAQHLRGDRDFESVVLAKLRHAQERKRLAEQLEQEEQVTEDNEHG